MCGALYNDDSVRDVTYSRRLEIGQVSLSREAEESGFFTPGSDRVAEWAAVLWRLDPAVWEDPEQFAHQALEVARTAFGARGVALVTQRGALWHPLCAVGQVACSDHGIIGQACVEEKVSRSDAVWIVPVDWDTPSALLMEPGRWAFGQQAAEALRRQWNAIARSVWRSARAARRCRQAEVLLEVVARWQATRNTEELLRRMAETSTAVLQAERASIFLWDRANRVLVAKPALGVEGGELRVPDDRGVVGQVVQTGRPYRVNVDEDQTVIDRTVDRKLGFLTHSLLCVPLVGPNGTILGAFEMINKQGGIFTEEDEYILQQLARHASLALENSKHVEQLLRTRCAWANQAVQGAVLVGEHPSIVALQETIRRVAQTELPVLLLGENGTGKEVVCRMIHALSRRPDEPLLAVNCAAMPETLLESELFGHEKGAFTDAREARAGKFEAAGAGTLFLDEIGELSLAGQAKLLRAIEEKHIMRLGGNRPIAIQARVIAATNRNLANLVQRGQFRDDLYYRLNVVTLHLPPLRERGNDVVLLARHFLDEFCRQAGRPPLKLTPAACRLLCQHRWPGNVRELRNLMERFAYLHPRDTIDENDLSGLVEPAATDPSTSGSLRAATRAFQMRYIREQLRRNGSLSAAAKALGMHRANLYRKIKQLGLNFSVDDRPAES